jgi:hypothetical protein
MLVEKPTVLIDMLYMESKRIKNRDLNKKA